MFDNEVWAGRADYSTYDLNDPNELALLKAWCQLEIATRVSNAVFDRLLTIVQSHQAQSAVLEHFYIDRDYRDEFSNFYSKTHYPFVNKCLRLHFFSKLIQGKEDLYNLDLYKDNYLGYSVLRPLPQSFVGRTMIVPPANIKPSDLSCLAEDEVHLLGSKLTVVGMPFIMQDQRVGVCAQASMWMILYYHYLNMRELGRSLPSDITSAATKFETLGRIIPSQGLKASQMAEGLRELGLPTLIYWVDELDGINETPSSIAKKYVASGLPVAALVKQSGGLHALTLMGFKYAGPQITSDSDGRLTVDPADYGSFIKNPVESFYINDDQQGPYIEIDLDNEEVEGLLVPSVEKMYTTADWANKQSRKLVTQSQFLIERSQNSQIAADFYRQVGQHMVYPSTYFVLSNEFKRKLALSDLPDSLKELALPRPLSRYVWVTEFVDINTLRGGSPLSYGFSVIDATGVEGNPILFLIYIPGYLSRRKSKSFDFEHFQIDEQPTYSALFSINENLLIGDSDAPIQELVPEP